jgi:TPR repeat protein
MKKDSAALPPRQCAQCGGHGDPGTKLVQCAACKQVCYCNSECQRAHWFAAHRDQCRQFRKLSAAAPPKKLGGGKGLHSNANKKSTAPRQQAPEKARPSDRLQELASQPRRVLEQSDGAGAGGECAICLCCMAAAETASLPCGHRYHCECVRRLREYGVNELCPQCRVQLPPGPEQCYDEAVRLLARADRMGACDEQVALAAQAAALLEQVLQEEPDHRDAQFCLGCCFDMRGEIKGAVQWCRKAAAQGHAGAQFNLGVSYDRGKGVRKDAEKAVEWFRKAAEQGNARAQFNLGGCYSSGQGVRKDAAKAVQWYRKTAAQGSADAQFNLGFCYEHGEGVRKDADKAVEWFRKAAAQGHAEAQHSLGVCYANGKGVRKDAGKAVRWYRKAAEQGIPGGQYGLSVCYANGHGVPKDMGQAVGWLRKAAEQGHAQAQEVLLELRL